MTPATLETSRLRLVPWDESHDRLLVRLSSMPQVMRLIEAGTTWSAGRATEVASAQREHWREHGFGWRAAFERASDRPVGFLALNFAGEGTIGLDPGEYEIGWWLDPAVWGRGLAVEGAAALRDEAFDRLGAPSIVARVQPDNERSIAVAEATGLRLDFKTTGRTGEPVAVYRRKVSVRP